MCRLNSIAYVLMNMISKFCMKQTKLLNSDSVDPPMNIRNLQSSVQMITDKSTDKTGMSNKVNNDRPCVRSLIFSISSFFFFFFLSFRNIAHGHHACLWDHTRLTHPKIPSPKQGQFIFKAQSYSTHALHRCARVCLCVYTHMSVRVFACQCTCMQMGRTVAPDPHFLGGLW